MLKADAKLTAVKTALQELNTSVGNISENVLVAKTALECCQIDLLSPPLHRGRTSSPRKKCSGRDVIFYSSAVRQALNLILIDFFNAPSKSNLGALLRWTSRDSWPWEKWEEWQFLGKSQMLGQEFCCQDFFGSDCVLDISA
ncbi:hypothetical protein Nepgr_031189 [Nepenthes gracilis]|uniref:Uncharacterized protein n=1 Tax=Nepenthes gracilis TaxID=150966 RepID=A0AAD3TI08_NEPGR|nr:hypothetical protein Nepgr_031189 [Nepenthes gracilis]